MNTNYQVIKSAEELRKAVESLTTHQVIGLDTETTELDPYYGRLRLLQLATPGGVKVIDLDAFPSGDPKKDNALAPLRDLLSAPRPIKILHNAKFDAKFIKHTFGTDLGGIFDTLLASQLLGAGDIEAILNGPQLADITLAGLTKPFPIDLQRQRISKSLTI